MPRRSWAVTVDDSEWPVVPFGVRETDVAVEIATEQMRVRVQRQSAALPASTQVVVCLLKMQIWMGWRLGAAVKKQIEADEHFAGW